MNQINVTTKKFADAVKIDLGQLPAADVKIDFNLTDGSKPVIAENKTFTLTIGTVQGELYKTDDDTVSYRYLKFDDNNVADSLAITMKMNGEEILNDTVSLTYQTSGGGSSVTVDSEMSESSPNPVANSTLTPIINAKADKATTIAGYGMTDAYTKDEGDAKVSSGYHYRGTVSAYADLPASGQEVGDVWNIETADSTHGIKAGDNVAWTGSEWDVLAGEIDLSSYATKGELSAGLEGKSDIDHLHTGKYVPLTEEGHIPGSYFVRGSLSNGGNLSTNGYVDAFGGFKKNHVSIDDIYAPMSHTHAMGDITGLPASGGTAGQVITKTETGSEWNDLPDTTDYLCFTALTAGSTVGMKKAGTPPTINLEYSTDKKHWTEYTWDGNNGATITLVNIGDKVWWRGDNTSFSSNGNFYKFAMTGSIEASGNVMSLLDKTCKSVTIPNEYCFFYLLSWNEALKTAPELPATKLANYCYSRMFMGCSSLTTAPELPATNLANYCYSEMFYSCTSLTTAPELPATNLANYCYNRMFNGCTSLTKAPELPATTMAEGCYSEMFGGCTNLNKVKVAFKSWGNISGWFFHTSSTGVFECPSSLDCSTRDNSHVPVGWTIVRTDSPKSITSPVTGISSTDVWINPNVPDVRVYTVSSSIKLNGTAIASSDIAYAEVVLDVATGATVTAGTNLTLVDTPTAGKRNICVCRWSGGVCKLYVTIVEDLPQA